jgi:hypothetical protein
MHNIITITETMAVDGLDDGMQLRAQAGTKDATTVNVPALKARRPRDWGRSHPHQLSGEQM